MVGCRNTEELNFNGVQVSNYFTTFGIYLNDEMCGFSGAEPEEYTAVIFENCLFENYNPRLFQVTDGYTKKMNHGILGAGYILTNHGPSGSVLFRNVTARDMMTHKARTCPTKEDLIISPDLSDWDTSRVLGLQEFYFNHYYYPTTAAIYFKEVHDDFVVEDCHFSRIFGISGSVITVDGLKQSTFEYFPATETMTKTVGAALEIRNTVFEDNFGFRGYPAIRIHQEVLIEKNVSYDFIQTDIYMNYFRCSNVLLENLTVTGNYGCPLATGVVWTACIELPIFKFDTDEGNVMDLILSHDIIIKLDEYWDIIKSPNEQELKLFDSVVTELQRDSSQSKMFVVKGSQFTNNRMAYSSGFYTN